MPGDNINYSVITVLGCLSIWVLLLLWHKPFPKQKTEVDRIDPPLSSF